MSAQGPPAGVGGGASGPPGGTANGPPGAGGNSTTPPWQPHIDKMNELGIFVPKGWYPGYDKEWKGYVHIPVHIVIMVLATIIILLRIYTRAIIVRSFGWDDIFMIIAWIITLAGGGLSIYALKVTGIGYHLIDSIGVNPHTAVVAPTIGYSYTLLHVAAIMFVKISILVFLSRIIPTFKTKWVMRGLLFLAASSGVASMFLFAFQCWPVSDFWMTSGGLATRKANCMKKLPLHLSLNIISAVIDGLILIAPIPTMLRSSMLPREKVAVLSVFIVGSGACIASFYRPTVIPGYSGDADPTYYGADLMITGQLEAGLGCICGSLPAIKKLIVSTIPQAFNSMFSKGDSHGSHGLSKGTNHSTGSYGLKNIKCIADSKERQVKESMSESTEEFRFEGDKIPPGHKYEGTYNNTVVIEGRDRQRSTSSSGDDSLEAGIGNITVTREYQQTSKRLRNGRVVPM